MKEQLTQIENKIADAAAIMEVLNAACERNNCENMCVPIELALEKLYDAISEISIMI